MTQIKISKVDYTKGKRAIKRIKEIDYHAKKITNITKNVLSKAENNKPKKIK